MRISDRTILYAMLFSLFLITWEILIMERIVFFFIQSVCILLIHSSSNFLDVHEPLRHNRTVTVTDRLGPTESNIWTWVDQN